MQEFPWIAAQRSNFGVVGSDYDWINNCPDEKLKEYSAVKQKIEEMKSKINKNVRRSLLLICDRYAYTAVLCPSGIEL